MNKYHIYRACEKHFEFDEEIQTSVYSLLLGLIGSIKDSKEYVGSTDLEKIRFFLSLLKKHRGEDDSYFGVQTEQINNLLNMLVTEKNKETKIVGIDINELKVDDVIAIFSTISRMGYIRFKEKIKKVEQTKKEIKNENFCKINDWQLPLYLDDEDMDKKLYVAKRIVELHLNGRQKFSNKDFKKAELIIKQKGEI